MAREISGPHGEHHMPRPRRFLCCWLVYFRFCSWRETTLAGIHTAARLTSLINISSKSSFIAASQHIFLIFFLVNVLLCCHGYGSKKVLIWCAQSLAVKGLSIDHLLALGLALWTCLILFFIPMWKFVSTDTDFHSLGLIHSNVIINVKVCTTV